MSHERWRANPIEFIETVLCDPETGQPFVLLDAEREFIAHAFTLDANGRLLYPELVFGAIKKRGKTTFAALHHADDDAAVRRRIRRGLLRRQRLRAGAVGRVFQVIKRIVEASPLLRPRPRSLADRISSLRSTPPSSRSPATLPVPRAPTRRSALSTNCGATRPRAQPPAVGRDGRRRRRARSRCRLTVTYAGFSGESVLLEELHKRGMALPEVGPSLHAGDGMLFAWHTSRSRRGRTSAGWPRCVARLRPSAYARMISNEFVSAESSFVDHGGVGRVRAALAHAGAGGRQLPVWVGVDAAYQARRDRPGRRDLRQEGEVRAAGRSTRCSRRRRATRSTSRPRSRPRCSTGTSASACARSSSIRSRWWRSRSGSRRRHLQIEDFPQTVPNLTAATQNLFDLIQSRGVVLYPDAAMRLAVTHAVIARELARLAPRQAQAAAQDRRRRRAVDGRARRHQGSERELI